ncbi:MAG: hypothetical protein AB7I30_14125 [Isosphaeraceae bacterium]
MPLGFRFLTRRSLGKVPPPLPLGLIGAVLLAIACESVVARHRSIFMSSHELDWNAAARDASGPFVRNAEVLLLGDSMVKFGLNPRVLQAHLGRRVYGLALLNGRPGASYFLLRRAIEAGARPKLVVVDYQPECMFEKTPHLLDQREWKGLLSPRECLDLGLAHRDPIFLARAALACALPSYRCRGEIRRAVLADLQGQPRPNVEENAKVGRNRTVNRGGMVLAPAPDYQGDVPPTTMRIVANPDWFGRPDNVIYIHRLLNLAREHDVRVVWLLPPNVPAVEAQRERLGVAERYTRFIRAVRARHPHLDVLDARGAGFGHSLFVDAVHLNRDGSAELSRGVADVLRGWLGDEDAPARWAVVEGPRGTGPAEAAAVALEDVEQSRAAIAAGAALRR